MPNRPDPEAADTQPCTTRGNIRPLAVYCLLAMLSPLCAAQDHAQDDAQKAGATQQDSKLDTAAVKPLSPVVITERRSEFVPGEQPFGVSTIEAEELRTRRLESVEQVLRSTPGINVNSSGGILDNNVYIRGVGSLYQSSSDDLIHGLSIDGVQVPSRYLSLGTLDVERIDILKGPQGTQTSASGAAGLIDVHTRRPGAHTEASVRAELGQQGKNLEEAAIGGALTDRLSGRLAVRHSGEDMWVTNRQNGEPVSQPDDLAFRASLLGELSARTSFELSASQQRVKESPNLLVLRPYGSSPSQNLPADTYRPNKQTLGLYSLRFNHDFESSRFSATSGYTTQDFTRVLPYDQDLFQALFGAPMSYAQTYHGREHVFSQDLRWASLPDMPMAWNFGLYFSDGKRSNNTLHQAPASGDVFARNYETRRYALYGDVSYPLSDRLKLNTGLRHEWSRRDYDASYSNSGTPVTDKRSMNDAYNTGRIGLSYAWTRQTTLYSSLARGYNAASFQDFAGQISDSAPYKAAKVNSAELGFKSQLPDQRLAINGALFYNHVKDNQTLVYDTNTFVSSVENVDTRSKGLELGGTWRVDDRLTVKGGVTYMGARILSNLATSAGSISSGNRMPDVARWSAALGVQYRKPLPEFWGMSSPVLNTQADYVYVGKRSVDPQNHFDMNSYGKLDLRVGVQQGGTEFYVWADNLLDKQYELYGYWGSPTVTYGAPARGRLLGLGFRHQL